MEVVTFLKKAEADNQTDKPDFKKWGKFVCSSTKSHVSSQKNPPNCNREGEMCCTRGNTEQSTTKRLSWLWKWARDVWLGTDGPLGARDPSKHLALTETVWGDTPNCQWTQCKLGTEIRRGVGLTSKIDNGKIFLIFSLKYFESPPNKLGYFCKWNFHLLKVSVMCWCK